VIDFAHVKAIEKGYHFLFKELHIYTHKEVKVLTSSFRLNNQINVMPLTAYFACIQYIIRKIYDFGDAYWRIWKAWKSYQLDNTAAFNNSNESVEQQKSNNVNTVQKTPIAAQWQKPLVSRSSTESNNNMNESKETFQQQQPQSQSRQESQPQPQPQQQSQWQQDSYEKNETLQLNSESGNTKQLLSAADSDFSKDSVDSTSNETNEHKLRRRFALVDLNDETDNEVLELNEKLENSLAVQHKMKRRTVLEDTGNSENKSLNEMESVHTNQAHPQLLSVPKRNSGPKRRPPQQRPHS
jgi:hypothetical protein